MATAKFLHYNSYGGKNTRADINGVKENVEYIFSIDVLLLLALVGFIDGGAGLFFVSLGREDTIFLAMARKCLSVARAAVQQPLPTDYISP